MKESVEAIVKNHMIFSMSAGAIPIPLADIAAVTAIQMDMIRQIADQHGVPYDANRGKSFAGALAGATLARMGASLVKSIPGAGTIVGIGAQVILSGASTYALGSLFDRHFSEGGTLLDFNVDGLRDSYERLVSEGKNLAKKIRDEVGGGDAAATIEKLKGLHDRGAITDTEFETTKARILERIAGRTA